MSATKHDKRLVAEVAAEIDSEIDVSLTAPDAFWSRSISIRKGRIVETYDTADEAIAGLRASWRVKS